jgi:iron complex outermembrane recepter protein
MLQPTSSARRCTILPPLVGLFLLMLPAGLAGQTPPAPPAPVGPGPMAADTIVPILLPELRVNILRSPIRADRAPFAVSVISEELAERGRAGASIAEALQGLPGVQVQNRYNDAVGELISIRGFGARSQFGVRGIRVLVDGIPATLPDGQSTLDHLDLGSLGRVEALRGPGAALYGNAAGGVLSFRSRTPPASPIRQEVRVVAGDYGMRRLQSVTSGSVGGASYLLSLGRHEWEGFRTRVGGGEGEVYGTSFREQLNGTFVLPALGGELRFALNHLDLDSENPGSLNWTDYSLGDRRAFPGNVNQGTGKTIRQSQIGSTWVGPVGDRELELTSHYIRRDLSNPIPSAVVDVDREAGGFRGILRTGDPVAGTAGAGTLWWALGFEAEAQFDDRFNWTNRGGERGVLTVDQRERVSAGAVFVQALLPINGILDAMTGLRYDRIQFSVRDRLPRAPGAPVESGSRTLDSASPSFGLHAAFSRGFGAYMNLSTAFETPTTTELANQPEGAGGLNRDLDPQVGITGELGARGLLGEVAAWELALFHTVLYNELVPFEVESAPGRRYFRNSGRSEREGMEAALQFTPDPAVSARIALSTNRARFRNYQVAGVDYSGNPVPGVAPYRVEGILRLGPGPWFAELRAETMGAVVTNDANTPGSEAPARTLVDLRAGANEVRLAGLRVSPFVGVTNLMDQVYVGSVAVNAFGARYFEPGPGRSLYLGASVAVQR